MIKTEEIMIEVDGKKLSATLSIPDEHNGSAVLFVPGSGKVDRNGNAKGMQLNIYNNLATHLNNSGMITLCYDKRGIGKSEGNYMETGVWDFVKDAQEWMHYLCRHPLVKETTLIGHSEGAIIGPAIMKEVEVDRFVFLCGSFGEGRELLEYQNQKIKEEIAEATGIKGLIFRLLKVTDKIDKQNDQFNGLLKTRTESTFKYKGASINAKWLREIKEYKITDYVEYVPSRSLAIEGSKDVQIKLGSAQAFASRTGAEVNVYRDMNHILRQRFENHTLLGLKKEYRKSLKHEEMHIGMINDLISFIKKQA